jgi:hypothetical protein
MFKKKKPELMQDEKTPVMGSPLPAEVPAVPVAEPETEPVEPRVPLSERLGFVAPPLAAFTGHESGDAKHSGKHLALEDLAPSNVCASEKLGFTCTLAVGHAGYHHAIPASGTIAAVESWS